MKSGQEAPLLSNFFAEGLFPNGVTALLITMITVNFSFQGTELIGIAAGESENPEKTIPKAIKQTVWRTLFFFVLSVFVLASMIPREKAGVVESPFVVVLDSVGVPYAADIMNFIILTSSSFSRKLWILRGYTYALFSFKRRNGKSCAWKS